MPTDDLTQPDNQPEGTEQQGDAQEQTPESTVLFKYGQREHQIPESLVQQFAEATGDSPEEVRNAWMRGKDYSRAVYESRRENAALRQDIESLRQALEALRSGRVASTGQPAQPSPPQFDPNDPAGAIWRRLEDVPTRADLQRLENQWQKYIESQQTQAQLLKAQEESQQFQQAYNSWAQGKRAAGFKNIPAIEEMDRLAADLELGNTNLPYEKALEVAWNVYFGDQVVSNAQKAAVDKLRDPKAKIVVPGSTGPAQTPQQKPDLMAEWGGKTMAELLNQE